MNLLANYVGKGVNAWVSRETPQTTWSDDAYHNTNNEDKNSANNSSLSGVAWQPTVNASDYAYLDDNGDGHVYADDRLMDYDSDSDYDYGYDYGYHYDYGSDYDCDYGSEATYDYGSEATYDYGSEATYDHDHASGGGGDVYEYVYVDDDGNEYSAYAENTFDAVPTGRSRGGQRFCSTRAPVTARAPSSVYHRTNAPLRRLDAATTQPAPQTIPPLNPNPNAVSDLSTRLPLPTVASPSYVTSGENIDAFLPSNESASCVADIPSKDLRQVRENLGMEMAGRGRTGRGAGEGVAASLTESPVSATQDIQHGPVPVSGELYDDNTYDQGFLSFSAVPMVHAGTYTDPLTGVESEAYESAMPPPDDDKEESINSSVRNRRLACLQGGWRDTTPRDTKKEVVEDDYHFQYDRSINTYGTYDASRLVERFERNNRYTRDDEHPDPDGTILVGTPANQDGIYNTKIRPQPYLPPTQRGKWAETTFRTGVDPGAQFVDAQRNTPRVYTTFAADRMESTRQDGGGMQPTANYEGFTLLQMGGGQRDIVTTQRSASEAYMPNMGPADYVRLNTNVGMEEHSAPTRETGTETVPVGYMNPHSSPQDASTANAPKLRTEQVPPAHAHNNTTYSPSGFGFGAAQSPNAHPQQNTNQAHSSPTSKAGEEEFGEQELGSYGATVHAPQEQKRTYGQNYKGKLELLQTIYSAFDPNAGYEQQPNTQAVTRRNDKKGVDAGGYGVAVSGSLNGTENMVYGMQNYGATTKLRSDKEAMYGNQWGFDNQTPDDSTRYLGYYHQRGDADQLNYRSFGSFEHPVEPASMAFFMTQRSNIT